MIGRIDGTQQRMELLALPFPSYRFVLTFNWHSNLRVLGNTFESRATRRCHVGRLWFGLKTKKNPNEMKPRTQGSFNNWIEYASINNHLFRLKSFNPFPWSSNRTRRTVPLSGSEQFPSRMWAASARLGSATPRWGTRTWCEMLFKSPCWFRVPLRISEPFGDGLMGRSRMYDRLARSIGRLRAISRKLWQRLLQLGVSGAEWGRHGLRKRGNREEARLPNPVYNE